jgi:hypothetical protein
MGVILGSFAVADYPNYITFDGVNIWISNFRTDSVTKLRASDGQILGVFHVPASPSGVAWDGANIWVASEVKTHNNKNAGQRWCDPGLFPYWRSGPICFFSTVRIFGISVWRDGGVTKLRASDGALLGKVHTGTAFSIPGALAFDGTKLWVTSNDNTVTAVGASNIKIKGSSRSEMIPSASPSTARRSG